MEPVQISFVIPAFNVEKYIDECLASIISSTIAGDEIVIIDDGSSDNTLAICKRWQEKNSRIVKLITQENKGLSAARNRGILEVTKKYVLFMDSDDVVRPDTICQFRSVLTETNADIIVGDFFWWHPERNDSHKRSPKLSHPVESLCVQQDQFVSETLRDSVLSACSRIFKTDLIKSLGPYPFPEGDAYEEIATVPRLTVRAKSLYYLPLPLFDYRVRANSITTTKSPKHCLDLAKAMGKFVHELNIYTDQENTKLIANTASAKFFLAAIRDCGLTPDRKIQIYENVVRIAMDSFSIPVEKIIEYLRSSESKNNHKIASQLALAKAHPKVFIHSRKITYTWKSFWTRLKIKRTGR